MLSDGRVLCESRFTLRPLAPPEPSRVLDFFVPDSSAYGRSLSQHHQHSSQSQQHHHHHHHAGDHHLLRTARSPVLAMESAPSPRSIKRDSVEGDPTMQQPEDSPPIKKRQSRAGTRSVTTLTAAQLERKRANDREAQRAIRQRTKEHIESLERRVVELSQQTDPGSRNLELLRRNEELEQENALLRNQLTHAMTALNVHESEGLSTSSSGIITPGTRSPIERHPILDTPRGTVAAAAAAAAARALPLSGIPQPQSATGWSGHTAYTTAAPASTIEPRPVQHQHPDVSPSGPGEVRWDTASSHAGLPNVVETSIHASSGSSGLPPHPTAAGYNYHVSQPYAQTLPYPSEPNSSQHQHQHQHQHPALEYRQTAQTPTAVSPTYPPPQQQQHIPGAGYGQYQTPTGGYMPTTTATHSPEGLPLMQRPGTQTGQQMMYSQR